MSNDRSERDTGKGHKNGSAHSFWAEPSSKKAPRAQRLTTVLLDRNPTWLHVVEQVLSRLGIDVVGKTKFPEQALALIAERKPDLLIAEVETDDSEIDGLACLRGASERVPELRTIVCSTSAEPEHVASAFRAGASAYVHKRTHPDDVAMAIRQLFEHSIHFATDGVGPAPARENQPPLSRRELEVLRLVAAGRSSADIASTLWITRQTVKFHLANIYRKLGVSNRTAAARRAHIHGLLVEPSENGQGKPEDET
jgi:two-component system, NarL family, response regulator DevR